MPRVYRADHTAHIRDRLKNTALYFSTGLILAVLCAATLLILSALLDGSHRTLTTAIGWFDITFAVLSALGLAITSIEYLAYRHRQADLDAAGAEAIGELYAQLHHPKDGA